jgi:signal transduction histidine kinase
VGVPLLRGDTVLAVLVGWSQNRLQASPAHIDDLISFGLLAAAFLETSVVDVKRRLVFQELSAALTKSHVGLSEDAALRLIMDALRNFPFDRVRLYRFELKSRMFIPIDSSGMRNPDSFLSARISADTNPYSRDIFQNILINQKARIYSQEQLGYDPDASALEKPQHLPWAVAPLVLNNELIGQIVVDNAFSGRELTHECLQYLDTISTFTVCAFANKRSIQFLSLNSLPTLYQWAAEDTNRLTVIKRLLIYITCGEALGFTRALFLEWHAHTKRFVYRSSLGQVTSEAFQRIAPQAAARNLGDILRDAANIYDYEIDAALQDFYIDASAIPDFTTAPPVVTRFHARTPIPAEPEGIPVWQQDLAMRLGESEFLALTLRTEARPLGLFIVDRQWQPEANREIDIFALRTFGQIATQILERNDLQIRTARQQSDREWENMSYFAAHECKHPVEEIELLLRPLTRAIDRGDRGAGLKCIQEIADCVVQLKTFIQDFLSLAQATQLVIKPFSLAPALRQIRRWGSRNYPEVSFEVNCPPRLQIVGDKGKLDMCFRELLANALYWMDKPEKFIRIEVHLPNSSLIPQSLDVSGHYAVVHFEDNGAGIPQEDSENIFNPTFTKRSDNGGTGIGLYMVKRIIEAHRGLICHYGKQGRGAVFALFLPVASTYES